MFHASFTSFSSRRILWHILDVIDTASAVIALLVDRGPVRFPVFRLYLGEVIR